MKKVKPILPDLDLLRSDPVRWSCNLHRIPKRLFWYYVAFALTVVIIWFRIPYCDPIIIIYLGLCVAILFSYPIILVYSGVPADEFIPTPPKVHLQSFLTRFLALTAVLFAPLLLGEIYVLKIRMIPSTEIISDINDINIGTAAFCRLRERSTKCEVPFYIPHSPNDMNSILNAGLPLLTAEQTCDSTVACQNSECLTGQVQKMKSALTEYDIKWFFSTQVTDSVLDGYFSKGIDGRWMVKSDMQSPLFRSAESRSLCILRLKNLLAEDSRPFPIFLYLDALLLSAWISFLVGIGAIESAMVAVIAWVGPLMVGGLFFFLSLLLNIIFPITGVADWPISVWLKNNVLLILQLYLLGLFVFYCVSVAKVISRPRDTDRSINFNYLTGYPLLLLSLLLIEPIKPEIVLPLTGNLLRLIVSVLLLLYASHFTWLRREGEKMRALPSENSNPVN